METSTATKEGRRDVLYKPEFFASTGIYQVTTIKAIQSFPLEDYLSERHFPHSSIKNIQHGVTDADFLKIVVNRVKQMVPASWHQYGRDP